MDDWTIRQLRESNLRYPVLTDVIFDYKIMLEMIYDSITIAEKGYDAVIDSPMLRFTMTNFSHGIDLIDKSVNERGIRVRTIFDINNDNINLLANLKHHDIRHIDSLRGNFGIFGKRAYMVFIFQRGSERPDQTLWSNSKELVDRQQEIFNKLWDMAIPLSVRSKELEFESDANTQRTLTEVDELQREFHSLIKTSKNELSILSSARILQRIINHNDLKDNFASLLVKQITIKLLTDNRDKYLIKQINSINNKCENNLIQLEYSEQMGNLDELILISDGRYVLSVREDHNNKLEGKFSKEEHYVHVQEILFEKYWNEIKSLSLLN